MYLNHEIKHFYIVPAGDVSVYSWVNVDSHSLYFIAGVDGVFTVVHKNNTTCEIKVPCCYNNPDYMATGADPDTKVIAIAEFLKSRDWTEFRVYDIAPDKNEIMACVKKKIDEDGWAGGRYFKD